MYYIFTGNSPHLLKQEVRKWKKGFEEKFGNENIFEYDFSQISKRDLEEAIRGRSLFSQKKLVIFSHFGETISFGEEEFFFSLLSHEQNENIYVFLADTADKRKSIYKKLLSLAENRDFSFQNDEDLFLYIHKQFPNIPLVSIKKISFLKENNLEKILLECHKISLYEKNLDISEISKYISAEFNQSIFIFLDHVLEKETPKIFSELDRILSQSNYFAFFASFLALLRTQVYIKFLQEKKYSAKEIAEILSLGNKSFLAQKKHAARYRDLFFLYEELILQDTKMKQGKLIQSEEEYLIFRVKKILVSYLSLK